MGLRNTFDALEAFAQPTSAQLRNTFDVIEVYVQNVPVRHSISDYLKQQIITHLFRSGTFTKPTVIYAALFLIPPHTDGTGGVEVSAPSYYRQTVGPADAQWSAPSAGNGITSNLLNLPWTSPAEDWGNVNGWALFDAASGGNLLVVSTFSGPVAVLAGSNPRFVANTISLTVA